MTCGEKIQKLRKDSGYTQEDLADILSVSRQSVSRWESDIAFPETDKLITLAKLFKCSIDYLLNPDNNDIKEVKESKTVDVKRFLLPIISIVLGLICIGLFFVNSFAVLKFGIVEDVFNYYVIAFFKLESSTYSPYLNIVALLAFICVIGSIITSIFLMVLKFKGIGITLNVLNLLTPFFLLQSIMLCKENVKAVLWILFSFYLALVYCSFYIKKLDFIESKRIMLPVLSLISVFVCFIHEAVIGILKEGFNFNSSSMRFNTLYFVLLLAIFVLSIILMVKNFKGVQTALSICNIVLCFLSIYIMTKFPTIVLLLLVLIQIINSGKDNLFGKICLVVLLFEFVFLGHKSLYVVTLRGATEGYTYNDAITFFNYALFRVDVVKVTFGQVIAFIVFILFAVSFIASFVSIFFEHKISNSILSVCNVLIPLLFGISLVYDGNTSAINFASYCLLYFTPYIVLVVCQFAIKSLRSPLTNKIFDRKRINKTA